MSKSSSRQAWPVLYGFLAEMRNECIELAVNAEGPDDAHAVKVTFAEMTERTKCAVFPGGLDFTSHPNSHRRFLYDYRVKVADELGLYYTSVYGVGLQFTANPFLGLKWREEWELEYAYAIATKTEELWMIAARQVLEKSQPVAKEFLEAATERRDILKNIRRRNEGTLSQLEREELQRTGKLRPLGDGDAT